MTSFDDSPLPDPPETDPVRPVADPAPEPGEESTEIELRAGASPILYTDLDAPDPIDAEPPSQARWLAFASIMLGGLLGGLIGYGTADLMSGSSLVAALGGLAGATLGALGVGVVAALTLRAMNEWHAVEHPESETRASSGLVVRAPPAERQQDPTGEAEGDDSGTGEGG